MAEVMEAYGPDQALKEQCFTLEDQLWPLILRKWVGYDQHRAWMQNLEIRRFKNIP